MGIWDLMTSTADPLKRTISVIGSAAVAKIGDAGKAVGIPQLNPVHHMPDRETRAKAAAFSAKFAENAVAYAIKNAFKWFPGAKAVFDIYSQTVRDMESGDSEKNEPGESGEAVDDDSSDEPRKPEGEEERVRPKVPSKL